MRKKKLTKAQKEVRALKAQLPLAKPTRKTLSELRNEADDWHSWYVRLRDCSFDGQQWTGTCITCSKTGVVAYLDPETAKKRKTRAVRYTTGWDNGHFVSRGHLITRFNEQNVNLQCLTEESNVNMYGNYTKSIKDVVAGDAVIAFDEQKYTKTVATVIQNVPLISTGLYKVELADGTIFKGTRDHRVLCEIDGGTDWIFLEDLHNMLHAGIPCNIITL